MRDVARFVAPLAFAATFAILATLTTPEAVAQEPATEPVARSEVGDAALGFWFRPPAGWFARRTDAGFILGSDTHKGFMVVMPHELTSLEAVRAEAKAGLVEAGVRLRLTGHLEPFGERGLAGDFEGSVEGRSARARGLALLSPHGGGGVTVLALVEPESYGAAYVEFVEALAKSVRFAAPAAPAPRTGPAAGAAGGALVQEWDETIRGRTLKFMESYFSPGLGTSGGYNIEIDITLCSNGEFYYRDHSLVSVDAHGGGVEGLGQRIASERNTGQWEIVARGGDAVLRLIAIDGSVREYTLSWKDRLVHLNGDKHFRVRNEICP